jgi:SAM-dependent methyltransferase
VALRLRHHQVVVDCVLARVKVRNMTPVWIAVGRHRASALAAVVLVGLAGASKLPALATVNGAVVAQAVAASPGVHPISGRRIAAVMSHAGADWLDRPEREAEERPDDAVEALRLRPGAVVADLGAGSGYFTVRLARRVGAAGRVFAVDIQPEMLSLLRTRLQRDAVTNVELVQSAENDPRLPARTFDLILMVDVYHELAHPQVILSKLLTSLKPAGRLVLLEYRKEDPAVPIRPEHKMSVADARLELEAEGFQLDRVDRRLPRQHILIFRPAR